MYFQRHILYTSSHVSRQQNYLKVLQAVPLPRKGSQTNGEYLYNNLDNLKIQATIPTIHDSHLKGNLHFPFQFCDMLNSNLDKQESNHARNWAYQITTGATIWLEGQAATIRLL